MRASACAVVAVLCGWSFADAPARADGSPVFVVPGKPGVPVIVNPLGYDASWMVVEGDFGLSRPGQVNPVILGFPPLAPPRFQSGGYFPHYGRLEIIPPPNRPKPPPAQGYRRSWSAESDPIPATLDPPAASPDISVDVDYRDRDRDRRRRDRHRRR
jgi:hypothetical protein